MHYLDRTSVKPPPCLALFDKKSAWEDCCCGNGCPKGRCPESIRRKAEVRDALRRLQIDRCAYCETALHGQGHIEHFRRKHRDHFPHLTFDWRNLFLSCDGPDTCGHFKDRKGAPAYNPDELVKPDEHNPECFLYFHSRGEVLAREGIEPAAKARANETIRVFGLNDPSLQDRRRKAIAGYLAAHKLLDEVILLPRAERNLFIEDELRAAESWPFRTAIHHFLKKYL
jgi:uncharacterized protein (TIGR02646 family)